MVATSIHYIISVFLAWKFPGKKKKIDPFKWGFLGILPDLDGVLFFFLFLAEWLGFTGIMNTAVGTIMFSHRGISHSLLLMGLVLFGTWIFWRSALRTALVGLLWGSHLLLDAITAWKFFPLLPFSYAPFHMGLVEVFDPLLTVLSAAIFGVLVSLHLKDGRPLGWAAGGMALIVISGFSFSIIMGEFNIETILLATFLLIGPILAQRFGLLSRFQDTRILYGLGLILVLYPVSLLGVQVGYQQVIDETVSIQHIEPLEEFAFNGNAHTYEIPQGDTYLIGLISYRGILEEKRIPKVITETPVDASRISAYQKAYRHALPINWINHPQWTFKRTEDGILYATITYAKQALNTPHMPGPDSGIDVRLLKDRLVRFDPHQN